MSGRVDDGVDETVGGGRPGSDYAAYAAARERFLERLRRDSELWRLERLWALPAGPEARRSAPPGRETT